MKTPWGEAISRYVSSMPDQVQVVSELSRKDLRVLVKHEQKAAPESDVLAFALCEAATRYLKPKKKKRAR